MNTDIDFMKIAEGDKAFVHEFENFVNGQMSSAEKTGMAMTTMHRYLQQQAFKVFMGYMKALPDGLYLRAKGRAMTLSCSV